MRRKKRIEGKDLCGQKSCNLDMDFEIQENDKTAGMGMPVTTRLCEHMVKKHFQNQDEIENELDKLESTEELNKIRERISPENDVVSGIYGRDTLMQILEQEGCEGIRYIYCVYPEEKDDINSKEVNSIVLIGVDKDANPVGGKDKYLNYNINSHPPIYEVKGGRKTRREINDFFSKKGQKGNHQGEINLLDGIL